MRIHKISRKRIVKILSSQSDLNLERLNDCHINYNEELNKCLDSRLPSFTSYDVDYLVTDKSKPVLYATGASDETYVSDAIGGWGPTLSVYIFNEDLKEEGWSCLKEKLKKKYSHLYNRIVEVEYTPSFEIGQKIPGSTVYPRQIRYLFD